MKYFRQILSFLVLVSLYELMTLSAVTWSFMESIKSSFIMIEYASTVNAANLLKGLASIAEPMVESNHLLGLESPIRHYIKNSGKSLDHLIIQEIFILSNTGILLYHSNSSQKGNVGKITKEYNQALYTRANDLSKWKVTDPLELARTEPIGTLDEWIYKIIPSLAQKKMMISAPIYQTKKLKPNGSIHLTYQLDNYSLFTQRQEKLYLWMLGNFAILSFAVGFLSWFFVLFVKAGEKIKSSGIPPFIEKVTVKAEGIMETTTEMHTSVPESDVIKVADTITVFEQENMKKDMPYGKKEIQDAIFLGK